MYLLLILTAVSGKKIRHWDEFDPEVSSSLVTSQQVATWLSTRLENQ